MPQLRVFLELGHFVLCRKYCSHMEMCNSILLICRMVWILDDEIDFSHRAFFLKDPVEKLVEYNKVTDIMLDLYVFNLLQMCWIRCNNLLQMCYL